LGALLRAAHEMLEKGTFDFASQAASSDDISSIFAQNPQLPSGVR
jgi:hypothetical protein